MIGRHSRERWYDDRDPPVLTIEEEIAYQAYLERLERDEVEKPMPDLEPPARATVAHPDGIVPPESAPRRSS